VTANGNGRATSPTETPPRAAEDDQAEPAMLAGETLGSLRAVEG
jgi:hypothetical protein